MHLGIASGGSARKMTPYSAPHPLVWQRKRKLLIPPISGRVGLTARRSPSHIKPEHAKMTPAAGKITAADTEEERRGRPVLATAANAFDHSVKRRVLAIDWIVRITQVLLVGHLIDPRLAVADWRRQQSAVRARRLRRWCG